MAVNITKINNFFNLCIKTDYILSTPILYTKSKSGKYRVWSAHIVVPENSVININPKNVNWLQELQKQIIPKNIKELVYYKYPVITYTTYGTEDGKQTISAPNIISAGKNIGHKNETNPFQQAVLEICSDYNRYITKGANTDPEKLNLKGYDQLLNQGRTRVNVMLLHDVTKGHWQKVVYPCYVQPKLDGIHLVAVGIHGTNPYIDLYTRGISKNIVQKHLIKAMKPLLKPKWKGFYITGELFLPGINRQQIASLSMDESLEKQTKLNFNAFDLFSVDKDMPFKERYELLISLVQEINSQYVKLVKAKLVYNRNELDTYFKENIKQYEGIVIRNVDGIYEYGVSKEIRSFNAMKYKLRDDFEFEITGFKSGEGKFANLIIFICKTNVDFTKKYCKNNPKITEFSVSPSWTEKQKKQALENGTSYIGKMATVSFDSVSDECIPIQPVLIALSL